MEIFKLLAPSLNKLPVPFIRFLGEIATTYLLKRYATIEIKGIETIKERVNKPTIFISNHLSNVDGIILNRILRENSISFMAGVKLGKNPFTSFFLKTVNHISINPGSPDKTAIKSALAHLKNNGSIMIFPEGTRSRTGSLIEAKKGFVLMVKMAGVPVVPIALEGTEKLLPVDDNDMGSEKPHKADVKISIGKPFILPSKDELGDSEDWAAKCTEFSMYRIAEMLEPKYQGVYRKA
ncbi:MAG: lysophospholipid acyltransferase family protein [Caulobacteraceae bacterium]